MRSSSMLISIDSDHCSPLSHLLTKYRYRPSPNSSYSMGQSSPVPTPQMMYSYGNIPLQGQQQQQAQTLQQLTRPSPPQPTWAVPQPHNPYYPMQRVPIPGSREDSGYLMSTSNTSTSQSLAIGSATFSSSISGSRLFATTDYFQGVIDTSKSLLPDSKFCGTF